MTDRIGVVYIKKKKKKKKLSYHVWSDLVQFMMKIKKDNNMTNRVGLVYAKNYTELLRPIKSSTFHEKTR